MDTTCRKFPIDSKVVYSAIVGVDHRGKIAGTVLGAHDNWFTIVLLAIPEPDGSRAKVFHNSVLELS